MNAASAIISDAIDRGQGDDFDRARPAGPITAPP
jgi:hypothetical protein